MGPNLSPPISVLLQQRSLEALLAADIQRYRYMFRSHSYAC